MVHSRNWNEGMVRNEAPVAKHLKGRWKESNFVLSACGIAEGLRADF